VSLKELGLVGGMLALGVSLALLDLSLFSVVPVVAFPIHNVLALSIGLALAGVSQWLLVRTTGHRPVLLLNILVGIGMIVIHAIKLISGKCA
jgi:hypothetical protein